MGNSPSRTPADEGEDEEKKRRESGSGIDMLKAGAAVAGAALVALGAWQLLSQPSSSGAADTDEDEAVITRGVGRVKSDRVDGGGFRQLEVFQRPSPRYRGEAPYDSPSFRDVDSGSNLNYYKVLSYNVLSREDLELNRRMKALGDLIQQHSPHLICFQEVTPNIYKIFQESSWWKSYHCSLPQEMAAKRKHFCMQMSKLPANFGGKLLDLPNMKRVLHIAQVDVGMGRKLVVATCHLKSPNPDTENPDRMYSEERVAQAKKALEFLKNHSNVVFGGDMNWSEEVDGSFPLPPGWIDAWEELRPGEDGWTFDTKANEMLLWRKPPLQKRLDRFLCRLKDFRVSDIQMVGTEAIPELSSGKKKVVPSDHFGLLLTMQSRVDCEYVQ